MSNSSQATASNAAKMWSGRFREPLNEKFEEWQRSFPFDYRLLPYEVEASIAHARAKLMTYAAAGLINLSKVSEMPQLNSSTEDKT